MVAGIDSFRDKFREFEDCYTVIGGAACDILMSEADIDFRLTKDIDMILILEDKKEEFAKTFWEYIKEGKYKCGWKNSDKMHFYRFTEPIDGISVLGADYIIPFKMYAWVDLKRRKSKGEHVNERDYKKHKNDVFRLLQIVDPEVNIETEGLVRESIEAFLTEVISEPVRTEQLGLQISMEDVLEILRSKYL